MVRGIESCDNFLSSSASLRVVSALAAELARPRETEVPALEATDLGPLRLAGLPPAWLIVAGADPNWRQAARLRWRRPRVLVVV